MIAVREVEHRKRRLTAVFARAAAAGSGPASEELQSDYARHLLVLVSGFVEKAVAEIIVQYARDKAAAPLRTYVESSLRRLTNVDKERLLKVVGSLDANWSAEMDKFVIDERQAAINSVVGLRNDIAHGGGSSISLRQVEKYWAAVQEIVDKLADIMLSDPRGHVVTTVRRRR